MVEALADRADIVHGTLYAAELIRCLKLVGIRTLTLCAEWAVEVYDGVARVIRGRGSRGGEPDMNLISPREPSANGDGHGRRGRKRSLHREDI